MTSFWLCATQHLQRLCPSTLDRIPSGFLGVPLHSLDISYLTYFDHQKTSGSKSYDYAASSLSRIGSSYDHIKVSTDFIYTSKKILLSETMLLMYSK